MLPKGRTVLTSPKVTGPASIVARMPPPLVTHTSGVAGNSVNPCKVDAVAWRACPSLAGGHRGVSDCVRECGSQNAAGEAALLACTVPQGLLGAHRGQQRFEDGIANEVACGSA